MKISADYRMLARDALRGKWKTAVLTGIAASALGATIVSSSNSVVSNSNQAKDIHFNLFAQPNGGRLLHGVPAVGQAGLQFFPGQPGENREFLQDQFDIHVAASFILSVYPR